MIRDDGRGAGSGAESRAPGRRAEGEAPSQWAEGSGAIEVAAPAKINLSLKVLGARPDGYHELAGLMARLAWGDTVRISRVAGSPRAPRPGRPSGEEAASAGASRASPSRQEPSPEGLFREDRLTFEGLEPSEADKGFSGKANLAMRALASYRRAAGFPGWAVAIHLVKRIPLASGLGGGSSDGAAVLKALEGAAGEKALGRSGLRKLAAGLGGDVPFFLEDGPLRLAGGIGEVLAPFRGTLPGEAVALANPGLALSTAAVFKRLGLTSGQSSSKSLDAAPLGGARPRGGEAVACPPLGHNDLLGPALELAPELAGAQALLARACPAPLASGLSGSGPTFWLVYGSGEEAARAASHLRAMAVAERPGERWLVVSTSIA